jgi:hypothetical protein
MSWEQIRDARLENEHVLVPLVKEFANNAAAFWAVPAPETIQPAVAGG